MLLALCALLGALGWWLGGYRPASIFVFCGLLAAGTAWWHGERVALAMVGARKAAESEAPAVRASLERLARRAGIVAPRLYLIADPFPRALSTGRGATASAVVLSSGFVASASPAEIEGVIAHEVAHIARRDVVVQTAAVLLASTLIELARLGGFLQRALLFVLGPVAAAFVHLLLSPRRELHADRHRGRAVRVAARPRGRAAAARPRRRARRPEREPGHRAAAHGQPVPTGAAGTLFDTHPPVAERVRRLRALDPDWLDKLRAA